MIQNVVADNSEMFAGYPDLLIELAVAVSTGGWWLDRFKCMKGRVLYVNLEIQRPQFMHRVCRAVDALIDMVELGINGDACMAERLRGRRGAIPFRLEFVLRDFKSPEPLDIWFTHPIHVTDDTGTLASCNVRKPGKAHCSGRERSEATRAEIEIALEEFMGNQEEVDCKAFISHVGKDKRTVNKHLEDSELFELVSGPSSAVIRRRR